MFLLTVPKPLCRACGNGTILQAATPGGYLGSITVEENNCGSASCPWILQALPGQKLNITLLDFAMSSRRDSNNDNSHFGIPEICYKYAVIKERNKKKNTTVCGGQERERSMYLSDTNSVHIEVAAGRRGGNFGYFLLHYEGMKNVLEDTILRFRRKMIHILHNEFTLHFIFNRVSSTGFKILLTYTFPRFLCGRSFLNF